MALSKARTAILAAAAALSVGGGMVASSAPAEARPGWGYHRGGYWGGGYRGYRPYYGYGGYYGGRRYYGGGGAVAAGLVGGLALGALASQASYPYYGGYPAYYATPVGYGGGCWTERRVRITPWGERIVRRVQVCN